MLDRVSAPIGQIERLTHANDRLRARSAQQRHSYTRRWRRIHSSRSSRRNRTCLPTRTCGNRPVRTYSYTLDRRTPSMRATSSGRRSGSASVPRAASSPARPTTRRPLPPRFGSGWRFASNSSLSCGLQGARVQCRPHRSISSPVTRSRGRVSSRSATRARIVSSSRHAACQRACSARPRGSAPSARSGSRTPRRWRWRST